MQPTILIIDDNEDDVMLTKLVLSLLLVFGISWVFRSKPTYCSGVI